jgi:hypothetical protein
VSGDTSKTTGMLRRDRRQQHQHHRFQCYQPCSFDGSARSAVWSLLKDYYYLLFRRRFLRHGLCRGRPLGSFRSFCAGHNSPVYEDQTYLSPIPYSSLSHVLFSDLCPSSLQAISLAHQGTHLRALNVRSTLTSRINWETLLPLLVNKKRFQIQLPCLLHQCTPALKPIIGSG